MTLGEALTEVYDTTDQQNDLDPTTAAGRTRVLGALTRAAAIVSTWKFPDGYRLRFRSLEARAFVVTPWLTGIVQAHVPGSRTVELDAGAAAHDLQGWSLDVPGAGFKSLVVAQAGAVVTIADAPDAATVLVFQDYTLSRAQVSFGTGVDEVVASPRPVEILGVYNVATKATLERGYGLERFRDTMADRGDPSVWVKFGHGFVLDLAPDEAKTYMVDYFHYPVMGVADNDELCALPEAFHEAIVQWARYWAFDRGGDVLASHEALSKLEKDLRCLRTEDDIGSDYADGRIDAQTTR